MKAWDVGARREPREDLIAYDRRARREVTRLWGLLLSLES